MTGLLMLGPHLTLENHVEVLARAKFRTKKEIAKLVRELNPLPRVPDLMEPLGPELPRSPRKPTWNEWVTSLCPPVRELGAGESPRDWANDSVDEAETAAADTDADANAVEAGGVQAGAGVEPQGSLRLSEGDSLVAPARLELPPITSPQQYQMQFCTTEEHVRLVEKAKALLARSRPGVSLGELHRRAMQLLVERLEKELFAMTPPSTRSASKRKVRKAGSPVPSDESAAEAAPRKQSEPATPDGPASPHTPPRAAPRQRVSEPPPPPPTVSDQPRRRARNIPAAVKRAVYARDAGSCSYVDQRGQRCGETRYLELDHLKPFGRGGEHVAANLALRCAAHNGLAAEEAFGRATIEQKRHLPDHDSLAAVARDKPVV